MSDRMLDRLVSFTRRSFTMGPGRLGPLVVVVAAVYVGTVGLAVATAAQEPGKKTAWDGVFTEAQVARGGTAFAANCGKCHGANLEGGEGHRLTGDVFWRDFQGRTVAYLFHYLTRSMPDQAPGSLPTDTYRDLAAFILSKNGFPAGSAELTPEATADVQIIRKDSGGELPASSVASVVGCLVKGEGGWMVTNATAPERTDRAGVLPEDATLALGDRSFKLLFVITRLDKIAGHRVRVNGLLVGDGGVDGINVTQVDSVSDSCN
jgi:S-disulfanyl-L-cysteine oxidoreductase SoxD